jgi:BirA family transcriptional regulator, biotin operon repressor / biotin---[acetyl-CoA-carboxylase] ligase
MSERLDTLISPNQNETVLDNPDKSWIGEHREEYNSIESTQTRAIELLKNGRFGAVVIAHEQTGGMGRLGRSFWSPKNGGLYLSVALPAPKFVERLPLFSLWGGLVVLRSIREAGVIFNPVPINLTKRLALKWPNDVLLDGKKLAGIIINGVSNGSKSIGVVMGCGINLNITKDRFPADLREIATSTRIATGNEWDIVEFRTHFISVIEKMWQYIEGPQEDLLSEWLRWGPLPGAKLTIKGQQEKIDGIYRGLNPNGEIILELSNGERRAFLNGIVEA